MEHWLIGMGVALIVIGSLLLGFGIGGLPPLP